MKEMGIDRYRLRFMGIARNLKNTQSAGRCIRVIKGTHQFPFDVFCTKPRMKPSHCKNPRSLVFSSCIDESISSMKKLRTDCIKITQELTKLPFIPRVKSESMLCNPKQLRKNPTQIFNLRQANKAISRQRYYPIPNTERTGAKPIISSRFILQPILITKNQLLQKSSKKEEDEKEEVSIKDELNVTFGKLSNKFKC